MRQATYTQLYESINDNQTPLKIVKNCSTRWLSIETAEIVTPLGPGISIVQRSEERLSLTQLLVFASNFYYLPDWRIEFYAGTKTNFSLVDGELVKWYVTCGMPAYSSAAMAGDVWSQWFTCCITQQPPQRRRRRRIDPSMIGEPTNFVHTAHIGSDDVGVPGSQLVQLQQQMKSKGGYEESTVNSNHQVSHLVNARPIMQQMPPVPS
ncbi:CRIB domain [Trinorchestia longiramus]|nr:CRIB domain [Trinorchestia longiramus]